MPSEHALVNRLCMLLDWLIALALAVMVVMVFGNVVLRYAFNSGIAVSEELSRWLFVWLTFIGALVALKEHGHLGTDMLLSHLSPVAKRVCLAVSQLLMLGITALIFIGSLAQARINWDVQAPVTGASMAVVYAAGAVFALPAALLLLRDLWCTLGGRLRDAEPASETVAQVRPGEDGAQ